MMAIMTFDLSILLISLILASAILTYYIFFLSTYSSNSVSIDGFTVIDIVRNLKKTCPIQFNNKWKLLPLNWSPMRCWSINSSFPGFKDSVKLYGATCAVNCSCMYAFSSISDVSKWGEWEPYDLLQNLYLKFFDNNDFKRDHFMLASQIASIQQETKTQSSVTFYRFLSLPSKCNKWILFWNAKKQYEFLFFLIQPATNRNVDIQCVITHIYGSDKVRSPSFVAQRLQNIKEFLSMSQSNIRPLGYSHTTASVPIHAENTAPAEEFLGENNCDTFNSVFFLVPFVRCIKFALKRLQGYNLVLKKIDEKHLFKKSKKIKTHLENSKKQPKLRRSVSDMDIATKQLSGNMFKNNIISEDSLLDDSASKTILDDNRNFSNVFLTQSDVDINEVSDTQKEMETKFLTPKIKRRSYSEPAVDKSFDSLPELSKTPRDDEIFTSLHSISEIEESPKTLSEDHDKNDFFRSSTSEFEVLDSNQQFVDVRMACYLTQGNYGASVLQTELMLASQFNGAMHTGDRFASGWINSSAYKGIPVFIKNINGKSTRIFSFLCQTEINVHFKDVWKCVKNPRFRFISDETVKTVEIIDKLSDSQKIVHIYHEMKGIIKKEAIDFCLLQTEREEKDNFYSVFQSIENEKCPFMVYVNRGDLKPSGWIVQNVSPKRCKVTYLIQILVNYVDNPFIQELNSLVPQSLYNLVQYITAKPK